MFIEPVDDDPIRQFTVPEERNLTRNLSALTRNVRLVDSKTNIYSIGLIRSWHSKLFDGVREHAGRFRSNDYGENILNFGTHRSIPRENVLDELEKHVITAHNLFAQLDEKESSQKSSDFIRDVIKIALYLHAMLIKIHPFRDGNGRVGRLVITFTLSKYSIPPLVIEVPKQEYIDCLNHFYSSNNSDIEPLYDLAIRIYKNQI